MLSHTYCIFCAYQCVIIININQVANGLGIVLIQGQVPCVKVKIDFIFWFFPFLFLPASWSHHLINLKHPFLTGVNICQLFLSWLTGTPSPIVLNFCTIPPGRKLPSKHMRHLKQPPDFHPAGSSDEVLLPRLLPASSLLHDRRRCRPQGRWRPTLDLCQGCEKKRKGGEAYQGGLKVNGNFVTC